ncbi:hypothetical protein [Marinomonas algicola]|uniref:hypothetical protein n=1 Tax=Marinomonas algicola TaxID=2773454 RepID=UPI00174B5762|nr:hypothetical protein [Marinomonas algicola]
MIQEGLAGLGGFVGLKTAPTFYNPRGVGGVRWFCRSEDATYTFMIQEGLAGLDDFVGLKTRPTLL